MTAFRLPIHKKTEPKTVLSIQRRIVVISSRLKQFTLLKSETEDKLSQRGVWTIQVSRRACGGPASIRVWQPPVPEIRRAIVERE
jgi:hypothetical protein